MSVNEKMTAIADAIRGKTGGTTALTLDQMATAISGIQTGSDPVLTELSITENGTYTPDDGVDGFSKVTVEVESAGGGGGGISAVKFMDEDIAIEESTSTAVTYTIDGVQIPTLKENPTKWSSYKGSEVYLFFVKQKEAAGEYAGTGYITKSAMFVVFGHTNYGGTIIAVGANKGKSNSLQKHGGGFSAVNFHQTTGVTTGAITAPVNISVQTQSDYVAQAGTYNVQGWMLTDFDWGF